jgi:hypothetical protein
MAANRDQAIFSERLWPSPGIWAAAIGFGAALGLIPAPINASIAVVVGVLGAVGMAVLLALTTPSVTLTGQSFSAGRARVPLAVVDRAEALTAEQARQARGMNLDARAYLCIRGWLPVGVQVFLADPEDPTPYWLVSSRRPEALATAIGARVAGTARQE